MSTKLALGPIVSISVAAALLSLACSSDTAVNAPPAEAGTGGGGSTGAGGKTSTGGGTAAGGKTSTGGVTSTGGATGTDGGDAGPSAISLCGGKTGQAQLDCGEYIVKHVWGCSDCHGPRGPQTAATFLTGNPSFADLDPAAGKGNIPTPNLTLLASEGWTAADVKDAFLNGKRSAARGGGLFPIMPYFIMHNMAPEDADAIAAFILSVPASGTAQPARETLPQGPPLPIGPVDPNLIPMPTAAGHQAEAMRGRYIAGQIGPCMECHTERIPPGIFNTAKLFQGGESFPPIPGIGIVTSLNITPANNGIKGWTPADVQKVILTGVDKEGMHLCPPMPFGPLGAFGGMDPQDALDIGYFLTSIPGIENPGDGGTIPMCVPPAPPDAGTPTDASVPDAAPTDAASKG